MHSQERVRSTAKGLSIARKFGASVLVLAIAAGATAARAEPLAELLPKLLEEHDRIKAAEASLVQASHGVTQAVADWLPTVDLTANHGHESVTKPNASDTGTGYFEIDLKATQLVFDFEKTSSAVRIARIGVKRSAASLANARQALMVEAATAYFGLLKAVQTLNFSRQSEDNIRRQTGMEEARVRRGSGFSTDVLQTKSQLAGAQASRARAEGALVNAINRFRAVFNREVGDINSYRKPQLPLAKLPRTLNDAIKVAEQRNLDLKIAAFSIETAKHDIDSSRADYLFPKIEATAEHKHKKNVGGTLETKKESIFKLELTYPLFSGFADQAAYQSSLKGAEAANSQLADARRSVLEKVRNAWQNLATQRTNAEFLRNQANISGEFLDLARRERQLGTRSLLDVLNGETSFINAISAAVSAETDMAVAVYNLLSAMGTMSVDVFKDVVAEGAPKSDAPSKEGASKG